MRIKNEARGEWINANFKKISLIDDEGNSTSKKDIDEGN